MLFSGRDIWRNGAFAYGGLVFAPGGLEQDGLLLKVLLSGGLYRYNAGKVSAASGSSVLNGRRKCCQAGGSNAAMPNSSFSSDRNFRSIGFWPDDLANRLRGNSFGLRMATELWYEPTPDTMIAADVSLSSIATSNSARLGYGWRVLEEMLGGVYLGPEIAVLSALTDIGNAVWARTSPA